MTLRPMAACPLALIVAASLAAGAPRAARGEGEERVEMGTVDLESLLDLSVQVVTRRAERASEAPATVFVVTAADIRRQGFRTVTEVLSSVPGLFTYPANVQQVGVRGMGVPGDFTSRLLVLVDGHPITNSAGSDLGRGLPVPLAAVQRVEVIVGPAGSVYGPSAFLGVVNLVTGGGRPGVDALAGGEGGQGRIRGGEGALVARWRGGAADALAAGSAFKSRGYDYTFPEVAGLPGEPAAGRVPRMDDGDAGNVYLRGSWRGLGASAACGHSRTGLTGALSPDPRNALEMMTCFAEATARGQPADGLTLTARLSADDFEARAGRALVEPPAGVGFVVDEGYDRWATAELRADWQPLPALRVDGGVTGKRRWVLHRLEATAVPALGARATSAQSEVNGWAAAELRAGRDLALHAGLTFYDHSIFGDQVTPKLAAVWHPGRDDTAKAIWSTGFRPPTFVEALFTDNLGYLANPALRPEKVRSAELVHEHRFGGVAFTSVGLFWNRYTDLIVRQPVPAPGLDHPPDPAAPRDWRLQAQNAGGRLDVAGGTAALTLRFGTALQVQAGASVQRFSERDRPNAPAATGNLAVSTRALWAPLLLTGRATAISSRRKDPSAVAVGQRARVPASVSLAAFAALDVPGVPGLQLELAALNLLDRANPSPAPPEMAPVRELPEAPRTFRADLRWSR